MSFKASVFLGDVAEGDELTSLSFIEVNKSEVTSADPKAVAMIADLRVRLALASSWAMAPFCSCVRFPMIRRFLSS
jgi:hypothetical protein